MMNRKEFLDELAFLLQDIEDVERDEAIQYYQDYFDEAGIENEQQVINELGTPEKVAAIIKAGINENFEQDIEYGDKGMSNSSFEQNQEIIKTKNNDVKNESHFKGNQERNKLLLILIIIGIVIFGIPVFSGLLGIVIGIVGGLFGVTLGSFCAGVGCLIGAVACFVKGIMILGELTGAALIIFSVGFGLIVLSFGFFWIGKMLVKIIPYLFKVGIKFCREMIGRVGEWYEKK